MQKDRRIRVVNSKLGQEDSSQCWAVVHHSIRLTKTTKTIFAQFSLFVFVFYGLLINVENKIRKFKVIQYNWLFQYIVEVRAVDWQTLALKCRWELSTNLYSVVFQRNADVLYKTFINSKKNTTKRIKGTHVKYRADRQVHNKQKYQKSDAYFERKLKSRIAWCNDLCVEDWFRSRTTVYLVTIHEQRKIDD